MSSTGVAGLVSVQSPTEVTERVLQSLVEVEAALLDERRYEEWLELYAEDGLYWAPAKHGQSDPFNHVSLFYDDKPTMSIRIQRLRHPKIHCQNPPSATIRLVSNFAFGEPDLQAQEWRVSSRFIMLEDRVDARRLYGGTYRHHVRSTAEGLRIIEKRVELTNCEGRFPAMTQPF